MVTTLDRPLPALLPSAGAVAPGTELPQHVASRALAQAVAVLTWGWLLTAPVVVLAAGGHFDVPRLLLVLLGLAAVAAGCTAAVSRRPDALLWVTTWVCSPWPWGSPPSTC